MDELYLKKNLKKFMPLKYFLYTSSNDARSYDINFCKVCKQSKLAQPIRSIFRTVLSFTLTSPIMDMQTSKQ